MDDTSRIFDFDDGPVAVQSHSRFSMPRRIFVGGIIATPLVGFCDFASGATECACTEQPWGLRLELSPSKQELTIIEYPPQVTQPEKKQDSAHPNAQVAPEAKPVVWTMPAAAFGPHAWFDMAQPSDREPSPDSRAACVTLRRSILIRNATYGNAQKVVIGFQFTRDFTKGKFERWTIACATTLWSPGNDDISKASLNNGVEFACFVPGQSTLDYTIPASRMQSGLSSVFSDAVQPASAGPQTCRISLDSHCQWLVRSLPDDKPVMTAFKAQVSLSSLQFGWRRACDGHIFFSGRSVVVAPRKEKPAWLRRGAKVAPTGEPFFRLDSTEGQRVDLFDPAESAWPLEIRVGPSPFQPAVTQVVLGLRLGGAHIGVQVDKTHPCGRIPASNLIVSTTRVSVAPATSINGTPAARGSVVRTVVWGSAFSESAKNTDFATIDSPIGLLRVGAPAPGGAVKPNPEDDKTGGNNDSAKACLSQTEINTCSVNAWSQGKMSAGSLEACGCPKKDAPDPKAADDLFAPMQSSAENQLFLAANGDRSGASASTVFIVHDGPLQSQPAQLRRITIELALFEASVALSDLSFSRLTFDHGALRLHFEDGAPLPGVPAEPPLTLARSYVWIGPQAGESAQRAVLDLTTATLICARDYDLLKLRFRFNQLKLALSAAGGAEIRLLSEACGVSVTRNGEVTDTRPVIVAEFDPQHVFEEAILRPEPLALPDIALPESLKVDGTSGDRAHVIRRLAEIGGCDSRVTFRKAVKDAKLNPQAAKASDADREAFKNFAEAYESRAATAGVPKDQCVYIGGYALDPDAMAIARSVQESMSTADLLSFLETMLKHVNDTIYDSMDDKAKGITRLWPVDQVEPGSASRAASEASPASGARPNDLTNAVVPRQWNNALHNEQLFEQQEPLYQFFRDHWRDWVASAKGQNRNDPSTDSDPFVSQIQSLSSGWLDEYFVPRNRPPALRTGKLSTDLAALEQRIRGDSCKVIAGNSPPPRDGLVGARLSGPSRLAFRINCEPVDGWTAAEAGLDSASRNGRTHPGPGNPAYRPIPFTFEALTDWSRHEPVVTLRAQKLFDASDSNILPPLGNRAANSSDLAILKFQGFAPGRVTGAQRMSDVRRLLEQPVASFETAIEMPARLILSTAQDAIWWTPRRLPLDRIVASSALPQSPRDIDTRTTKLEDGATIIGPGVGSRSGPWHLWSARLLVDRQHPEKPGVRAVASPDLRPMAMDGAPRGSRIRLPGAGAPMPGPWAPWYLGAEQSESGALSPEQLKDEMSRNPESAAGVPGGASGVAQIDCEHVPDLPQWQFFRWLCDRARFRKRLPADNYSIFRTSLDAYDRNQLVLLTSAYGLPVTGARETVVDAAGIKDPERSGNLVSKSGQIEPGDDYMVLDGRADQAIYRPIPLAIQELSLSALGGSLLHDTTFKPAAGADDVFGKKIFEGLTIQRWQHEIVLGRDIRAEVVYKGYLLPFGHLASLVKLTERMFLATSGGIKALLRQRFFIRVARPKMIFPAIGQAFEGRLWCGKLVTLNTTRTPDLIDPTLPLGEEQSDTNPEALNGRIHLGPNAGMAFWPRTDITPHGVFAFDVSIGDAKVKMPLMFVNNIAATDPDSLQYAVYHYNGALKPPVGADGKTNPDLSKHYEGVNATNKRRATVDVKGQTIAFADAKQSGDTSVPVEWLQIQVHGRDAGVSMNNWIGELNLYQTIGSLEGAQQPPFYPRLYCALIWLKQVERFSGTGPKSVRVQYDGHYVRYGFAKPDVGSDASKPNAGSGASKPDDSAAEFAKTNPAEVFLDFLEVVPLTMGANGNRSAGIARPESWLIALSRQKGPLGGDEQGVVWQAGPNEDNTSPKALVNRTKDSYTLNPLTEVTTEHRDSLVSLVWYFRANSQQKAQFEVARAVAPGIGKPQIADAPSAQMQNLKVVQSYFSGDAKILGAITIRELLFLLDFAGLDIPALREVTEYGTNVSEQVNEAAHDLLSDVRSRVLSPLREVVDRLQSDWNDIDAKLLERQGGQAKSALTLSSIYPEVNAGLLHVHTALDEAIGVDRAEDMPAKLSALYESAQQLIQALASLASHPVERLQEAVKDSLLQRLADIKSRIVALGRTRRLSAVLADIQALSPKEIANWLMDGIKPPMSTVEQWTEPVVKGLKRLGNAVQISPLPAEPSADAVLTAGVAPPDLVSWASVWFDANTPRPAQLAADLSRIATDLGNELTYGAESALQDLLTGALQHVWIDGEAFSLNADWVQKIVSDASARFAENVNKSGALRRATDEIEKVTKAAGVSELAQPLSDALTAYGTYVATHVVVKPQTDILTNADLALFVATVRRISATVTYLRELSNTVQTGDATLILRAAEPLMQDLLGVNIDALNTSLSTSLGSYLDSRLAEIAAVLETAVGSQNLQDLRARILACHLYLQDTENNDGVIPLPQDVAVPAWKDGKPLDSAPLLALLANAIVQVAGARPGLKSISDEISRAQTGTEKELANWLGKGLDNFKAFHENLVNLVVPSVPDVKSIPGLLKGMYCDTIDAMVALRAMQSGIDPKNAPPAGLWNRFDRAALDLATVQIRSLRQASERIGEKLRDLVQVITAFLQNDVNRPFIGAELIAASAAYLTSDSAPPRIRAHFDQAAKQLKTIEAPVTAALFRVIVLGSSLVSSGSKSSAKAVGALQGKLGEEFGKLTEIGLSVDPEGQRFLVSLGALQDALSAASTFAPASQSATLALLLQQPVYASKITVAEFFGSSGDTYRRVSSTLRNAEQNVVATWYALLARLAGQPERLRGLIEAQMVTRVVGQNSVFAALATGYDSLVETREGAIAELNRFPATTKLAQALVVDSVSKYDGTTCEKAIAGQTNCDLLLEEDEVAGKLAMVPAAPPDAQAATLSAQNRGNLVRFLGAWRKGSCAPLAIIRQSDNVVVDLVKGDLLSVIDLAAFRDQLEEAVANLVPTRVNLSYDFVSQVTQAASDDSIFQPEQGADFGIHVRGTVDLRNPSNNSFRASGALGPFKVKLVGNMIDAIELRFHGAEFEMSEGQKPRFTVGYDDFRIGKDLDFVKQLEPFLSPKDGNGIFVQPMTRGAGIEAGFGINLPSIGVGETSFFNVILNVSAELPFDSQEALFKVGLGRRLSPFSVSMLPFCGSGFFSIFCAADGVRGFEASFEFGAGGSLAFGPLTAQCRIQIGVYVELLKVNDIKITSLYGTFFAGGSATLWIFNFSTSLYVRLGQQGGGAMYGDAVYSFSFSLGIAKYNYSVTAFHTEKPLGKGTGNAQQTSDSTADFWPQPVLLAAADIPDGAGRSDVGGGYFTPPGDCKQPDASSRNKKAAPSAGPVTVESSGQRDWTKYHNYFDYGLVKDLVRGEP